jgi:hypothetical protein
MEEIPSLLNTDYKYIAAIAKAVSEFAKTGIIPMCSVNRILFLEKS